MAESQEEKDRDDLETLLMLLFLLGWNSAAEALEMEAADATSIARAWAAGRASDLLRGLKRTTDARASRLIERATTEGWSFEELMSALAEAHVLSPERARLIARTEMVRARNIGQASAFLAAGVLAVRISDGVLYDVPCKLANGARWSVVQYLLNPLEHPNCVRDATPILEAA